MFLILFTASYDNFQLFATVNNRMANYIFYTKNMKNDNYWAIEVNCYKLVKIDILMIKIICHQMVINDNQMAKEKMLAFSQKR